MLKDQLIIQLLLIQLIINQLGQLILLMPQLQAIILEVQLIQFVQEHKHLNIMIMFMIIMLN